MIDIHSHILPGIDDGARDARESAEMLKEAAAIGVSILYATPHAKSRADWQTIQAAYEATASEALRYGIRLRLGLEVLYDLLIRLDRDELPRYCYHNSRTLLLEFHSQIIPHRWEYTLSGLKQAGYQVIIAHPERYRFVQEKPDIAMELRGYGALLQLDAESLAAKPWDRARRTAQRLLTEGQVSFIASDAHDPKGYRLYGSLRQKLEKAWPPQREIE